MNTMRIPTQYGEMEVAMVDRFETQIDGQTFTVAVNVSPVMGKSLKASSFPLAVCCYASGRRILWLPHGKPRKYIRADAVACIQAVCAKHGEARVAQVMREAIAKAPLNTLEPTSGEAQGGAA